MNIYGIFQGVHNKESGTGCDCIITVFTNKKEAVKFFNKIKKDTSGYHISKNEYLETYMLLNDDLDNPIMRYEYGRL